MKKNENEKNLTTKFKVGDLVVCIEDQYYKSNKILPKNVVFEVSGMYEFNTTAMFLKDVDLGSYNNFGMQAFRLATENEINYYKFPDKFEKLINE